MSSCTECHGMVGLHTSNNCPRVTGARLYTPKELEELKDNTYKEGFDAGFSSGLREGKRLHKTLQNKKQSK